MTQQEQVDVERLLTPSNLLNKSTSEQIMALRSRLKLSEELIYDIVAEMCSFSSDVSEKLDLLDVCARYQELRKHTLQKVDRLNSKHQLYADSAKPKVILDVKSLHYQLHRRIAALLKCYHLGEVDYFAKNPRKAAAYMSSAISLFGGVLANGLGIAGELAPVPAPLSLLALPVEIACTLVGKLVSRYLEKEKSQQESDQKNATEESIKQILGISGQKAASADPLSGIQSLLELTMDQQIDLFALHSAYDFAYMVHQAKLRKEDHAYQIINKVESLFSKQLKAIYSSERSWLCKVVEEEIKNFDKTKKWLKRGWDWTIRGRRFFIDKYVTETPISFPIGSESSEYVIKKIIYPYEGLRRHLGKKTESLTHEDSKHGPLMFESEAKALIYKKVISQIIGKSDKELQLVDL